MNQWGSLPSPDRLQLQGALSLFQSRLNWLLPEAGGLYVSLLRNFQFYVLPIAANNHFADLSGVFSFADQLMNKETLLETKRSADAVRGRITIEQTVMTFAVVAHAVAGLLRENFRMLLSVTVRFGHDRIGELLRIQHRQQRLSRFDAGKVRRNSGRRLGRRLMIRVGIAALRRCSATGR